MKQIDDFLGAQPDWQRQNLELFRNLIHRVEPEIKEDWKWSVPVFLAGAKLVCAMSTFKGHTKFNFFEGAALPDPAGLFNSGLDSKKHRSINLPEGTPIDNDQLKNLIKAAVDHARS